MSAQGGATGSVHVNVFGGPGSGKSTMAYAVAAELKARGYTAECVGEVAKDCIYDRPSWASPTSPPTPTRTGRRGWRPSRRTSSRHRSRST